MPSKLGRTLLTALFLIAALSTAFAQQDPLTSSSHQSVLKTQAVEYLYPEQVSVAAGKTSPVTLHFRIQPNLHINSHTPRAEYLVPTVFSVPEASGVKLAAATYPPAPTLPCPPTPTRSSPSTRATSPSRQKSSAFPAITSSKRNSGIRPATRLNAFRQKQSQFQLTLSESKPNSGCPRSRL